LAFRECVAHLEIGRVDDTRKPHYPIRDSCEIFDEVKVIFELFIGGARWVGDDLRGIVRNKEVIICLNLLFIISESQYQIGTNKGQNNVLDHYLRSKFTRLSVSNFYMYSYFEDIVICGKQVTCEIA
jgi:hypothetical protein